MRPQAPPVLAPMPLAALPPPAAAAPALPPGTIPPEYRAEDVPGEVWVFAETIGARVRGAAVPSLAGVVAQGDRGVFPIGGGRFALVRRISEDSIEEFKFEDLRVLPVSYDGQGERRRTYASAVQEMVDDEPEGGLVTLRPPRTAMWALKDMLQNGGSPSQHFEWWLRTGKIPEGDRASYEMEVLCSALEAMTTVDQLNAPSLTSAEIMVRRVALIKEAHRISPSAPDYSAGDYFMGWGMRRSGATIAPALSSHVAEQLRSDAQIAKESRKAREEMALRRNPGKKNKKQQGSKGQGKGESESPEGPG